MNDQSTFLNRNLNVKAEDLTFVIMVKNIMKILSKYCDKATREKNHKGNYHIDDLFNMNKEVHDMCTLVNEVVDLCNLPLHYEDIMLKWKRPTGVSKVTDTTTLVAQVAKIHKLMKNLMTPEVTNPEPVKVVTDASEVSRVYYEGAHFFEECSAKLVFVIYVGNNKYNNSYNNTCNPGWRNHPISRSNNQNQLKPQATQAPQIPLVILHLIMM
ncbi:hypothetical protein KIW84_011512 [Lathyrus oleraceus]|uniref:Uncharacterized protein n=1 Tax=Pisum sativum TaxID=3888 RepID=A0A9D5GUS1_PEA|nr:hypothetical protein KIW84_011512 [Pisum sativum]